MEENIINNQTEETKSQNNLLKTILPALLIVVMVFLGVFSGYQASKKVKGSSIEKLPSGEVAKEEIGKGKEFGMKDPGKADNTIGVIEKGGINGEGTHQLLREGGPSQTVYMTSSVLDLDQFVGEKVQVWGETNKAQKAGWLMDVIKLKVLD
jgi:hypothetical protein